MPTPKTSYDMLDESDQTLVLECWSDELSPAQMAFYDKAKSEQSAITDKLKELMTSQSGEELYIGEVFSAFQFQGKVTSIDDSYIVKVPTKYKGQSKQKSSSAINYDERHTPPPSSRSLKRKAALAANIILDDDDDEEDVPLAKRSSKKDRNYNPPTPKSSKNQAQTPVSTPQSSKKSGAKSPKTSQKDNEKVISSFRPSESSAIGGLTVGQLNANASVNNVSGDPKEAAKLQGKTFPSLVVVAKPHLKVKEQSGMERSALDSKVKVVLMLTPAKFTEWLIQQGLLKSEQKCAVHSQNELKLGVYSDGSKFPYSGGYVWISECCPTRFISVFHGSLFEGAPHPPSCILKLIYHWACQTNIQNVVQWVKVDNLYIKGVYTWLRAICTLALNKHLKFMGGHGKYVEVGVISLGTTAQDGQQRQVKVEVLGVLDHSEKVVRLRAIEPFSEGDRSYKKRFAKILEPLHDWVAKDSIITIDLTVDKTTIINMGYKNVLQVPANDTSAKHTNSTIMDYLRRIVPRMFQNTLSLLSRQMIQQFLDELVWREQFGTYPLQAFDSITAHLAEQTRLDTKDTLTQRLYQVATNPFKIWKTLELKSPRDASGRFKKLGKDQTPEIKAIKISHQTISAPKSSTSLSSSSSSSSSKKDHQRIQQSKQQQHHHIEKIPSQPPVETKGLEELYYGILPEDETYLYNIEKNEDLTIDLQCPQCSEIFKTNSQLQADLLRHVDTDSNREDYKYQCVFCLEKLPSERGLRRHESLMHPSLTKHASSVSYHCLICQVRFSSVQLLCGHLNKIHVLLELPYICHACGYRTSSHHNIIEHFYKNHHNENMLQCPLCLAVFWIFLKGKVMEENIRQYYNHVQRHFDKTSNKKCNKCVLTFITRGEMKYHALKDHPSFSGNSKVYKLTDSTAKIPIPKNKHSSSKPSTAYKTLKEFPSLVLDIVGGKLCLECDRDLDEGIHINGFYKCQKCEYKTCCLRAMLEHTSACPTANAELSSFIRLEREMHCVCGFSSSEGNSLARHLALCDHKSVYPTVEAAQDNTVKRNMLDMLGLVRREGENENNIEGGGGGGGGDDGKSTSDLAADINESNVNDSGGDVTMSEVQASEQDQEQETEQEPEHEPEQEPEPEQDQDMSQDDEIQSQEIEEQDDENQISTDVQSVEHELLQQLQEGEDLDLQQQLDMHE